MSDVSRGPGWWIASDGKWYAPELHPDAQRVATETPLPLLAPVSTGSVDRTSGWSTTGESSPRWTEQPATPNGQSASFAFYAETPSGSSPSGFAQRFGMEQFSPVFIILIVAIVLGGAALGYVLLQGSNSSIASETPAQIVAAATNAARSSGSVHAVTTTENQGVLLSWVNDTGTDSGEQTITGGPAKATAIVVNGGTYFTANQQGMMTIFSASASVAHQTAGKWLSLAATDPAAKAVADSLTMNSLLSESTPQNPLSNLGTSTVKGNSVVGISGSGPGGTTAILYVSATGQPLPVEEIVRDSSHSETTIFSDWGEPVHLAPPANVLPGSSFGF